jgi:hypothetical protein
LDGLNADSDRLNRALHDAEKSLRDLNVGVPVSVMMSDGRHRLSFSRDTISREWGLHVATNESQCRSVHQASRELRVEASKHLRALHEQLLDAASRLREEVAAAADEAEGFLDLVRARQAGEEVRGAEHLGCSGRTMPAR